MAYRGSVDWKEFGAEVKKIREIANRELFASSNDGKNVENFATLEKALANGVPLAVLRESCVYAVLMSVTRMV